MRDDDRPIRRQFERVAAFIDWNSQLLAISDDKSDLDPVLRARMALNLSAKNIARALTKFIGGNFRVSIRLYHGWCKGFEPTTNKRAIQKVLAETDFSCLSPLPNIVFEENVGFGDCLISALPERFHQRLYVHLPNTLRDRGRRGVEEKMVDTAMATDILTSAYQNSDEWALVVAEDDDLVPPLFAAEVIFRSTGARALLLSRRRRTNPFLKLDGIVIGA